MRRGELARREGHAPPLPTKTAGPVERAGVTERLVTGMPMRWMSARPSPIGIGASSAGALDRLFGFLARCADDGLEAAVVAHGGMPTIRTAGVTAPIEIETKWHFVTGRGNASSRTWKLHWTLSLDAGTAGRVVILNESLRDGDRVLSSNEDYGDRVILDELNRSNRSYR